MTKLILINVIGTLVLAGVLSAAHVNPTMAASENANRDQESAALVRVEYQIRAQAPDVFDAFLDLSPADREQLLFRLADERSMRLLAITNASRSAGPMDAR